MAQAEVKFKEGLEHMRHGEKAIATTWLKWKPDWDLGAKEFDQAATCFKNAKAHEQAKEAYVKASESHVHCDAVFSAATALENAAMMSKLLKHFEEAAQLYEQASKLFLRNGNPDKGSDALTKAGETILEVHLDQAVAFYIAACDLLEEEGREQFSAETFRRTVSLLVKAKKYDKALEVLRRQVAMFEKMDNKPNMWKGFLSIVVVLLTMTDYVQASREYQNFLQVEGFFYSDESKLAHELLDAFETSDQDRLQKTAKSQTFNFLENEITKLARELKVDGFSMPAVGSSIMPASSSSSSQGAAAATATAAAASSSEAPADAALANYQDVDDML